jgi:hypothetical protein
MGALRTDWAFADAWVLAAIGIFERPCSLLELIAAADVINHGLLVEAELEDALGKLTGSGLVRVFEGLTFELTDDGMSLWSQGARDLQGQLLRVKDQLSDFEPVTTRVKLPKGAFDEALAAYTSHSGPE